MGGTRASHYLFVSTVDPILNEFHMWVIRWTTVVEDVWEHMAKKKREMQGHGEAIVPHLVEFQENTNPKDSGLIIQFHDSDGELVHTYKDPSREFKYRIIIKDAPKKTTVWTVIGVDEDNWWNEYAPGMDCMREFSPGPVLRPECTSQCCLCWETSR